MSKIERTTTRELEGNLQRRQYELIADVLFNIRKSVGLTNSQHNLLCAKVADELSSTAKNFKWTKFYYKATGVTSDE